MLSNSATPRREPQPELPSNCAGAAPRLAVVVPCFNEAESIGQLESGLRRLETSLADAWQLELVLVDDGSRDATWTLLQDHFGAKPNISLIRHETNRGIAAAIASGIAHTDADVVASLDADCTYDPALIAEMAELLTAEVDMVVASPYHPAGAVEGVPRWRLQLSQGASRLYRIVLRNKLHTYTSCVRVYRRDSVCRLRVRNPGFVGVVELAWALDAAGGCIVEHPATLRLRAFGQSKMRVTQTTLAHLRFLARATVWHLTHRRTKAKTLPKF